MLFGEAVGFGAEEQGVAEPEPDVGVVRDGARGERENPGLRKGCETGIEILVHRDLRQIVVVQPGPAQVFFAQVEAEWFNQMQVSAGSGAHPDRVTGVRRDHRIIEDDVQQGIGHGNQCKRGIMAAVTAIKLDGRLYRGELLADLSERVTALKKKGVTPGLATVLVGDDPGSHSYVRMKHRDCAEVGINSIQRELPEGASQKEVNAVIDELNADPACTGYIVQLPLPSQLDENAVLERIDPAKDADGLHPVNLGKLVLNEPAPLPCTPNGAIHLLRRFGVELNGAKVVVIGRGVTVGRPLGLLLTRRSENSTVTLCHTGTRDLKAETRAADVIVAAAGKPHMLTPDMVKEGAAVLDVGVSRLDGGLAGDVHPDVWEVAGSVSPNPGGIGPMTRTFLLANVVERAEMLAES